MKENAAPPLMVYRNELALSARCVTPDPGVERLVVAHVAAHGGRAFFERPDWRAELFAVVLDYRRAHPPAARREDDAEFTARLRDELAGSRAALEAITGRPVRFLCWPNGGTCPEALALLAPSGYLASTRPSRESRTVSTRGTDPARIGRISASSFFRGSRRRWPWVMSFALKVERNRGNVLAEIPLKAIWLYRRFVRPSGATPAGAEF